MLKKAVVVASTSKVTSGSGLPREKVEHAFKLLEVSSRIPLALFCSRSSGIMIFLFLQEALGWEGGRS